MRLASHQLVLLPAPFPARVARSREDDALVCPFSQRSAAPRLPAGSAKRSRKAQVKTARARGRRTAAVLLQLKGSVWPPARRLFAGVDRPLMGPRALSSLQGGRDLRLGSGVPVDARAIRTWIAARIKTASRLGLPAHCHRRARFNLIPPAGAEGRDPSGTGSRGRRRQQDASARDFGASGSPSHAADGWHYGGGATPEDKFILGAAGTGRSVE